MENEVGGIGEAFIHMCDMYQPTQIVYYMATDTYDIFVIEAPRVDDVRHVFGKPMYIVVFKPFVLWSVQKTSATELVHKSTYDMMADTNHQSSELRSRSTCIPYPHQSCKFVRRMPPNLQASAKLPRHMPTTKKNLQASAKLPRRLQTICKRL